MFAALISPPSKLRRICPSSSTSTRSEVRVMLSRMWEENRTVPCSLYPAISWYRYSWKEPGPPQIAGQAADDSRRQPDQSQDAANSNMTHNIPP